MPYSGISQGGENMTGKTMRLIEADRILRSNGFIKAREGKEHTIYKRCTQTIALPKHGFVSQKTWKRECKKNGLEAYA